MTASLPHPHTRRGEFWAGVRDTLPLVIGAIPFGIIFGAVAVANGISPAGTLAMSLFVFAGSAQFVAAGLVASGAGVALIILTTFIVNLRHALYSATLAPHVRNLPQRWLIPLGFMLTDETFLVVAQRFACPDTSPFAHWFYLGSALFMYVNWQVCTLLGILAGQYLPNPQSWGLDFALPVTFIGMLVPMLRSRPILLCAAVAAAGSLLFRHLPYQLGLIVTTLVAVGATALVERAQPASYAPRTPPAPEVQNDTD